MVQLNRIHVLWTGFAGAPGYSTFYTDGVGDALSALTAFYGAIKASLPNSVNILVQNSGEIVDPVTGLAVGVWNDPVAQVATQGTGLNQYTGAEGAVVNFLTAGFRAGRMVRGRTFLVPLNVQAFDAGSISGDSLSAIRGAANTLITTTAGHLYVLSAPYVPKTGSPRPAAPGQANIIVSAQVPDFSAILRTRRT